MGSIRDARRAGRYVASATTLARLAASCLCPRAWPLTTFTAGGRLLLFCLARVFQIVRQIVSADRLVVSSSPHKNAHCLGAIGTHRPCVKKTTLSHFGFPFKAFNSSAAPPSDQSAKPAAQASIPQSPPLPKEPPASPQTSPDRSPSLQTRAR